MVPIAPTIALMKSSSSHMSITVGCREANIQTNAAVHPAQTAIATQPRRTVAAQTDPSIRRGTVTGPDPG